MFKKIITIVIFCAALLTLLKLSHWQVERLQWKNNVIKTLHAEYQKDPAQHQFTFSQLKALGDEDMPLYYGRASGLLLFDKEILVGPKPFDGAIGYNIITPLKLSSGAHILVNRGWIEDSKKEALKTHHKPKSTVIIDGVFRKPQWNKFTPNNSPENNIWTKLNITQIAKAKDINPIAPVMLYASNLSLTFDGVILQDPKWYPRNKHKQYAIFWFAMALTLILVFGLFIWKNRKDKR